MTASPPQPGQTLFEFRNLIGEEGQWLSAAKAGATAATGSSISDVEIARAGPAEEPWVCFTTEDYFGLALSGGGIRSATFNLGLLQGLDRKNVLEHVDYLSTVSGGGYVGGFWTAWQHHGKSPSAASPPRPGVFPRQEEKASNHKLSATDVRETGELRHLREFSRFLMPRVGFLEAETWNGIVTILGGLIPSLVATVALLGLGLYAWLYANYWLLFTNRTLALITFTLVTLAIHLFAESLGRRLHKGGKETTDNSSFIVTVILAVGLSAFVWLRWRSVWAPKAASQWLAQLSAQSDWVAQPAQSFTWLFFGPAAAWAIAALALLFIRALTSRWWIGRGEKLVPFAGYLDSATGRLLAPAVVWAAVALVWESCRWLAESDRKLHLATGSTVLFGALFAWLKDWLARPKEETHGSKLLSSIVEKLKPLAPRIFANAAVISLVVVVGVLLQRHGLGPHALWGVAATGFAVVLTLVCFDLARVGMHDFYRSRIARCYLGAARARAAALRNEAETARPTMEQADDDLTLDDLFQSQPKRRPIHLVCCAANSLAGDTLGSLYRGARSAVLSPSGISLGNYTARLKDLRLSSALTASAAAFNSQMGRISMCLGPAVAFLMSALNLRLGLWVPHPLNPRRKRYAFPGWYFFLEMFGMTRCEPVGKVLAQKIEKVGYDTSIMRKVVKLSLSARNLHLSDGNHFENLGLYELIRRHCRYVIVSDCSADPEIAFDDLANTLRRIREDFGVEIDLDVGPLKPGADKRSKQHAVIGTIHYDGLGGADKGTLLYFKPTVTGDEPPDVLQYQTRNNAFPHEGTSDQFYDEAQWESYRRLGEHAGNVVLRFLEKARFKPAGFVENVFLEASQIWHPAFDRQGELFLNLTERCSALEAEIRDHAPAALRAEFFPEVAAVGLAEQPGPPKDDDAVRVLYFVMLVAQAMEDVWLDAQLDTFWSHPLNEGWMNYFQRWASTPSFRRWWPILRPIYSPAFRDFVKDRFDVKIKAIEGRPSEPSGPGATLKLAGPYENKQELPGLAWEQWLRRYGRPEMEKKNAFEYFLALEQSATETSALKPLQGGFLLYAIHSDAPRAEGETGKYVQWSSQEFFVPHSLIGAGIMARFLDSAIHYFCGQPDVQEIRVTLDEQNLAAHKRRAAGAPGKSGKLLPDPASRRARVQTINFYKSRGFVYLRHPDDGGDLRRLRLDLVALRAVRKREPEREQGKSSETGYMSRS